MQTVRDGRDYIEFEFAAKAGSYIRHALAVVTVGNGAPRLAPCLPPLTCALVKGLSTCIPARCWPWSPSANMRKARTYSPPSTCTPVKGLQHLYPWHVLAVVTVGKGAPWLALLALQGAHIMKKRSARLNTLAKDATLPKLAWGCLLLQHWGSVDATELLAAHWLAGNFYTLVTGANERRWDKIRPRLEEIAKSFTVVDRFAAT